METLLQDDVTTLNLTNGSGSDIASGGVLDFGDGIGVAVVDVANAAAGAFRINGVHTLAAKSADTWSVGDRVYWDTANTQLTITQAAHSSAGVATAAKTGGQTTNTVLINASQALLDALLGITTASNTIWVDGGQVGTYTADGSRSKPYTTVTAAIAAMTSTRNRIAIMPGTYTEAATLTLPAYDCYIFGVGAHAESRIDAAVSVSALFTIAPASLAGTVTYYLSNLLIANSESSQVGIQIDNANAGKKIIVVGTDLEIEDGGNAIDVDHAGASDAVRIYINNGGLEIEGAINFDVGNNGDKLYVNDAVMGGLMSAKGDDVAALFRYKDCIVPADGAMTNDDTQTNMLAVCLGCYSVTGVTYAALDTNEIGAGSNFTETIA